MKNRDLRNLGYGFGIGALLASLFFAVWVFTPQFDAGSESLFGLQPSPTPPSSATLPPTATLTSTLTATNTATPTASATLTQTPPPLPTATRTESEALVASGEIFITGPLSQEQQIRLYEASLSFFAPNLEQSKKISVMVNQVRFSDPSTTCGPLSIAILQKAGLLSQDLIPHDFFLINPDIKESRDILASAFPAEKYTNTRRKIRIDQEDWTANPLLPGDFVYLYAGRGGNFEHMFIVTRIDSQRRAYSMTNYNTPQGFVIQEALLYDPADSNAGLFSQWTEKQYAKLGSTGYSGYEVWRLKDNQ